MEEDIEKLKLQIVVALKATSTIIGGKKAVIIGNCAVNELKIEFVVDLIIKSVMDEFNLIKK